MAGHSKWSKIKRQKAVTDQKRSGAFTKLSKAISIAVKEGGGTIDPSMNFRLRLAVEKAREANMPKANIERAIEQGAGKNGSVQMETIMYEGYGPEGCAVLVESVTDNRLRSLHEIRQIFEKGGGTMGQVGSVNYLFDQVGWIFVNRESILNEEELMLQLMEIEGVVDIESNEDGLEIYTEPTKLKAVQDAMEGQGIKSNDSELIMKAKDALAYDEEKVERVMAFVERMEDCDEVQRVFVNVAG